MSTFSSSTSTSSYTGPGVLPAEDSTKRNLIIIIVVGTVVGLSIIAAGLFFFLKRNSYTITVDDRMASPVIPQIQPDMISARVGAVTSTVSSEEKPDVLPIYPLAPDEIKLQEDLKANFREQQVRFKELRDGRRMTQFSKTGSPSGRYYGNKDCHEPSSADEEGVFSVLSENLTSDSRTRASLYKELILQWHPDKHPSDSERAKKVFQYLQSNKDWFLRSPYGTP